MVQEGKAGREHRQRAAELRVGVEAHRRDAEGADQRGEPARRAEEAVLHVTGRYVRRHRLRRHFGTEGHRPAAGGHPAHHPPASDGTAGGGPRGGPAAAHASRCAPARQGRAGDRGGGSDQLSGEVLQVLHPCAGRRYRGLHHPRLRHFRAPGGLSQRRPGPAQAQRGRPVDQGLLGQRHAGELPHHAGDHRQGPHQHYHGRVHGAVQHQDPRLLHERPQYAGRLRPAVAGHRRAGQ